jgi:hypothetical protein
LAAQFIESYVTFVYKKRKVAELLAKGELTAGEANILSHYQLDITRDRAIFQTWRNLIQAEDGYTLAQIKTFLLNNRATILNLLRNHYVDEIATINALKDQETSNAVTEEQIANLPTLLAELDNRISKRQMWHDLVVELRDANDTSFADEAEMG